MIEMASKTKKGEEQPKVEMVSVEEANAKLQSVAQQANQQIRNLSMQLARTEQLLADKTIDMLFEVLKHELHFSEPFVKQCSEAVEKYITTLITEPENKDSKEKAPEAKEE